MRRGAIIISLFLLLIASASGFEEWVYSGEPFTFEDETYYAYLDTQMTSATISNGAMRTIVRLGTCETINFIRYCLEDVATLEDFEHIKFDVNGNRLHGFKLLLETVGPRITVSDSYSTTKPDVNGRIQATITIQNKGNRQATSLEFTYTITPGVKIEACGECTLTHDGFTYELSSLGTDEDETITFAIDVLEPKNFNASLTGSYEHEGRMGEVDEAKQVFTISKPYSATMTAKSSVRVGEETTGTVTLKNTGQNPIMINATLIRDPGLTYAGDLFESLEKLNEGITLEPGASETYEFITRSTQQGTYKTNFSITVTRESETFTETFTHTATYSLQDLSILASTSKDSVVGGDTNTLYVTLKNDKDLRFENIRVDVNGAYETTAILDGLASGALEDVIRMPITHPHVENETIEKIYVNVSYETNYGEELEASKILKVTVLPLNESYRIEREIAPKEPAIGEKFVVTVKGQKMVDSAVRFTPVSDAVAGAEEIVGGRSATPILSDDLELLYQYEANRTSERLEIVTGVAVTFKDESTRIESVYLLANNETIIEDETGAEDAGDASDDGGSELSAPSGSSGPSGNPNRNDEGGDIITLIIDFIINLFS